MKISLTAVCACLLIVIGCAGGASKQADRLQAGDPAPDFMLTDLIDNETYAFGKEVHLNRATVVTIWSMECPSCREALLEVQKSYEHYSSMGIGFAGVNFDVENLLGVRAFIRGEGVDFPMLWDKGRRVTRDYKALDYTFSIFIVDSTGALILAQYDHPPDLSAILAKALDPFAKSQVER